MNLRGLYQKGTGVITINKQLIQAYFNKFWLSYILEPVLRFNLPLDKIDISMQLSGGGVKSIRTSVRVAIMRCLIAMNKKTLQTKEMKSTLKPFSNLDNRKRMPTRFLRRGARAKPQLSFR